MDVRAGSPHIANSAQPKRQRSTAIARDKRAHPVITLADLSVNEINKEPVTFQENRQHSSSSTETWKLVG